LASNLSGVTVNILLHWMHTRWRTGLCGDLGFDEGFGFAAATGFAVVSALMDSF